MKRDLPAHVYAKGKNGYLYFVRGSVCERIKDKPGTPEFAATYARLMRGHMVTPKRTIKKLLASYMQSDRWKKLKPNTQKDYRKSFRHFEDVMPLIDPATLRRVHVIQMRDALADTPTTANHAVVALSVLLEHAIDIGWLRENPANGIVALKSKKKPRGPWPVDLVEKYRERADGLALLIFEMLVGTGQRVNDVLAMKWGDIEGDGINVAQDKTDARLWVPFTDRLRTAVKSAPKRGIYIVTQENGKPVSYQLAWKLVTGIRKDIGALDYDLHALRHYAASEIASLPGMTAEHVQAITGHSSTSMVRLYAGAASQRARALEAQKNRK